MGGKVEARLKGIVECMAERPKVRGMVERHTVVGS